jgi:hypothetical protein
MYTTLRFLRRHLLASVALFLALGGTSAYAAVLVTGADIADGTVESVDIMDGSLAGVDISDGSVVSADVGNNTLTTTDVLNGTLTASDIQNETLTGSDVQNDSLTGADIDEASLNVGSLDLGCQNGLVKGRARINGTSGIPAAYVDQPTFIDKTYNCSGDIVEVRRESEGVYFVKFHGISGDDLALVVPNQDGASTAFSGDADNSVTVGKITAGGDADSFRVDVHDSDVSGDVRQDGSFTIMVP